MKLKLYDYLIILGLVGSLSYAFLLWIPTVTRESSGFNILGAFFMITMGFLFLKAFIVFTGAFIEWGLPKMSKKFETFKFKNGSEFTLFNKRIEFSIRIIDKNNSKVTF